MSIERPSEQIDPTGVDAAWLSEPTTDADATDPSPTTPTKRRAWILWLVIGVIVALATAVGVYLLLTAAFGPRGFVASIAPGTAVVYTDAEDHYSVSFPGKPVEAEQTQSLGGSDVTLRSATLTRGARTFAASASSGMPAEALAADRTVLLQSAVDGVVSNTGATLTDSSETTLDGEQAMKGAATKDGVKFTFVISLHNDVLYSLTVANPHKGEDTAFYKSFDFTD
ncbi:hypothetical protein WDJ51_08770 [Rathayibacter sp. YIM 133350]|uniref:hypothetical protein n=1 Tax=Rathayibacter sp. YIM 133350 TaxID=3131992 RepID=UPI00307D17EB